MARLRVADLLKLWRRSRPPIWHARRNNEMIAGVLLHALGWPLKVVFTSAEQRYHTWTTRFLIRRMDAIIATSDLSASYLKRSATVIPHGVDTDGLRAAAGSRSRFCRERLAETLCHRLLRAGGRRRAATCLSRRCARLLPRYPDVTAVMVGAIVPEQMVFASDLKRRIEAAGLNQRIVILGELEIAEVQRWYQRLTVYAFTLAQRRFWADADPMAAGAALVAARAGAAELVVEDRVSGVLVPPGDVDALVAALEPLMRNPEAAAAMGARGRTRAVEKFSLDAKADRIVSVYRTMVRRHRDRRLQSLSHAPLLFLALAHANRLARALDVGDEEPNFGEFSHCCVLQLGFARLPSPIPRSVFRFSSLSMTETDAKRFLCEAEEMRPTRRRKRLARWARSLGCGWRTSGSCSRNTPSEGMSVWYQRF